MAQRVQNQPAMQETQVRSLGQEDSLEKGMAIHSSVLAWKIPWTEEPASYSPWGHKESDRTEQTEHTVVMIMTQINLQKVSFQSHVNIKEL